MTYEKISPRDYIGSILCEVGDDERVFVLDSDLAKSTTTNKFKEAYPNRFIEMGIAETSAMSVAHGLANEGMIPFYVNFAMFVTGTAWTQLRQACYANANVKVIGTHPGLDDGPDGASHHANEDIALARVLPNMKILIPASIEELKACIQLAIQTPGPMYIRVARDVVPVLPIMHQQVSLGKANMIYDEGNDVALLYEGCAALQVVEAYDILKAQGIHAKLIQITSIKPFDTELLNSVIQHTKLLVTIENHSILGGLGGIVAEELSQYECHPKLIRCGIQDVFTESGSTKDIKKKYGIDGAKISAIIHQELHN